MKLVYNGYQFDNNEIQITLRKREVLGRTQRRSHLAVEAIVKGVKIAATPEELTAKLGVMEASLVSSNGNLIFYDNDDQPTIHSITANQTLNGIRVSEIQYMDGYPGVWGARTEYVNRRTYRVIFSADVSDPESNLIAYSETISLRSSGGHDFTIQQGISGVPTQVITADWTPLVLQQRGMAIGYSSYPFIPPPLYPLLYLKKEPFEQSSETPLSYGRNGFTHYPVAWLYTFEAPTGLILQSPPTPTL